MDAQASTTVYIGAYSSNGTSYRGTTAGDRRCGEYSNDIYIYFFTFNLYIFWLTFDYFEQLQADLESQEAAGTFVPQGDKDVLTVALKNPEHPGRSRGRPHGYGKTDMFGKRATGSQEEMISKAQHDREISAVRGEMTQKFSMLEKFLASQGFSINLGTQPSQASPSHASPSPCPPEDPTTARGSSASPDDRDLRDGLSRLHIDGGRFVGWGKLYPDRAMFHNVAVPADLVVVQIIVVEDDAPLPIPDGDEVATVQAAASGQYFVLWPRILVDMVCFLYVNIYFNKF